MARLRGCCASPQDDLHPHDVVAAALSRDIYLDRVPFELACVRAGLEPVDVFDHAGTQAALARELRVSSPGGGAAWLVFRGTEATRLRLVDLAANLLVRPKLWAGAGWVHCGYADALERVRDDARRLAERVSTEVPLYATGHSLGGVLATLYAAWVSSDRRHGHRLAGLVTFGAPRGGSAAALAPICGRVPVRRYVMPSDPAPWWPAPLFRHPPGKAIRLQPAGWWPGPVSRHSVVGYAVALAAGCAGS